MKRELLMYSRLSIIGATKWHLNQECMATNAKKYKGNKEGIATSFIPVILQQKLPLYNWENHEG